MNVGLRIVSGAAYNKSTSPFLTFNSIAFLVRAPLVLLYSSARIPLSFKALT